ncbi:MAG: UDP-glucose 4-epimerase GalE [Flavobacteriales bacterium]|nr:UDP-glucose 4-epimerase GalE [Flavobacteriales bacterium]
MKKILITGGAGYIGSHTILEILENTNWEVVSADNFLNSSASTFDRIEKISGKRIRNYNVDLRNLISTKKIFEAEGKIDGVIHFAALKAVGESVERPLWYYDNNFNSLLSILRCCRDFNVPDLIFSSSCSIYGNVDHLPVDENTALGEAESPYAHTKAVGEDMLRHFVKTSPTRVISLRYFNPVGAHKTGQIGENPINKPNNLVPVITQTAAGINEKMWVHGNDYKTRDGSCIRDYIHVTDIADAHIKALQYLQGNKNSQPIEFYNLGTGNGISVLEAIDMFEEISGLKLNFEMGPRRPGDVEAIYSDSTLAKNRLGWETKFGLKEMMQTAWKWQQEISSK